MLTIVSCFYQTDRQWIHNFLKFMTYNFSVIVFTSSKDIHLLLPYESEKCKIYPLENSDFDKIFLTERVIQVNPFKTDWFAWVDIRSSKNDLNSLYIQKFKFQPTSDKEKVFFLDTHDVSTNKHTIDSSFFWGYSTALLSFIEIYRTLLVFTSTFSETIENIISENSSLCSLVNVNNSNWVNKFQSDPGFYIYNHMMENSHPKTNCTPILYAGIGNRMFQVASVFGISQKNDGIIVLNEQTMIPNPHSKTNYLDTIFKNFVKSTSLKYTHKISEKSTFETDSTMYKLPAASSVIINGYLQSCEYFHPYRKQICELFDLPLSNIPEGNIAFIHLRLGDYINHPLHYIDLDIYYKNSIRIFTLKYPQVQFRIFSSDPTISEVFAQKMELQNYIVEEVSDELQTLADMKQCKLGGICANSTYSWWGGYLNLNPVSLITLPKFWFSKNQSQLKYQTSNTLVWENVILVDCELITDL